MEEIRARFAVIKDPRHPGYVGHKLADALMRAMCAVFCGLDSLGNILIFAENNKAFLREELGIEKIPSKATLARILAMVDGAKIGEIMISLMQERYGTAGNVVAVDGKAICSTAKAGSAHSAKLYMEDAMNQNSIESQPQRKMRDISKKGSAVRSWI